MRTLESQFSTVLWLRKHAPNVFKHRIARYHANIGGNITYRKEFMEEFRKEDSCFSVVIASSALGQVDRKNMMMIIVIITLIYIQHIQIGH